MHQSLARADGRKAREFMETYTPAREGCGTNPELKLLIARMHAYARGLWGLILITLRARARVGSVGGVRLPDEVIA